MSSERESISSDCNRYTHVSLYLGDCDGPSVSLVCDGVSDATADSIWARALDALAKPSPPGPYPSATQTTLFVYETVGDMLARDVDPVVTRVDVRCGVDVAHVTVRPSGATKFAYCVQYVVGDDAVVMARRALQFLL
ncbi:hypothetical protein [Caballeronia sp. J97]|uniref:hypothetical protein n=1 Tax=Caballeronia sp. J97 TaxID=2805429 RepID=UPI002AB1915A|nr:hypothetical protein [Caballeronia sp. J97]